MWEAEPAIVMATVVITLLASILPVTLAWFSKKIFDLIAISVTDYASAGAIIWPLLILQTFLLVFQELSYPIGHYLDRELGRKLSILIEEKVHSTLNRFQGLMYFEMPHFHDLISVARGSAHHSSLQAPNYLISLFEGGITLASFIGVLIFLNPLLTLFVLAGSVPQLVAEIVISHKRALLTFSISADERKRAMYSHLMGTPQGAKEVRLFNLGEYLLSKLLFSYKQTQRVERDQDVTELRWQAALGVISSSVSGIALAIIILQTFAGVFTIGDVALAVAAITGIQRGTLLLIRSIAGLNESRLFFGRYEELVSLPFSLPIVSSPKPVPSLKMGIEFRDVWFRYPQQLNWTLQGIGFTIQAGTSVALVGLNGAGKTTIVKLLARLYDPDVGQILWDGIDIREFDPEELRRSMSTVAQDFIKFDLSVAENIGLGDVANIDNKAKVQRAAQRAGIHEMIEELPSGYETILSRQHSGEGGQTGIDLSGGQWQKIAIARMLMRETSFVVLDEPAASLDPQAEFDLFNKFTELMGDRASLLISHRLNTVRMMDDILVIGHGRVLERGKHEDLLTAQGAYAKLYKLQEQNSRA